MSKVCQVMAPGSRQVVSGPIFQDFPISEPYFTKIIVYLSHKQIWLAIWYHCLTLLPSNICDRGVRAVVHKYESRLLQKDRHDENTEEIFGKFIKFNH